MRQKFFLFVNNLIAARYFKTSLVILKKTITIFGLGMIIVTLMMIVTLWNIGIPIVQAQFVCPGTTHSGVGYPTDCNTICAGAGFGCLERTGFDPGGGVVCLSDECIVYHASLMECKCTNLPPFCSEDHTSIPETCTDASGVHESFCGINPAYPGEIYWYECGVQNFCAPESGTCLNGCSGGACNTSPVCSTTHTYTYIAGSNVFKTCNQVCAEAGEGCVKITECPPGTGVCTSGVCNVSCAAGSIGCECSAAKPPCNETSRSIMVNSTCTGPNGVFTDSCADATTMNKYLCGATGDCELNSVNCNYPPIGLNICKSGACGITSCGNWFKEATEICDGTAVLTGCGAAPFDTCNSSCTACVTSTGLPSCKVCQPFGTNGSTACSKFGWSCLTSTCGDCSSGPIIGGACGCIATCSGDCVMPEICDNSIDDVDDDLLVDCADIMDCPDGSACGGGKICNGGICMLPAAGVGICGNGVINNNEVCDFSVAPNGCPALQTCNASCTACENHLCGDGIIDIGEACDFSAIPTGCGALVCNGNCTACIGASCSSNTCNPLNPNQYCVSGSWFDCPGGKICSGAGVCGTSTISLCDINAWYYCSPLSIIKTFSRAARAFLEYVLGIIGAVALLFIVIAGIMYITSAGNEERITASKRILTGAVMGLGAALLAYSLLWIIVNILDVV